MLEVILAKNSDFSELDEGCVELLAAGSVQRS